MPTECDTCKGEGFIDGGTEPGLDARTCDDCQGTGVRASVHNVYATLSPAEREMLLLSLDALWFQKRFIRRLGRPAGMREIVALAHKLGLSLWERHDGATISGRRPVAHADVAHAAAADVPGGSAGHVDQVPGVRHDQPQPQ